MTFFRGLNDDFHIFGFTGGLKKFYWWAEEVAIYTGLKFF